MELYIGNLPDKATVSDLNHLFRGFSRKLRFRFEFRVLPDGHKARYAVAEFDSPKLAQKAMLKLRNTQIYGHMLEIHEYSYRSYNNERRAPGWRNRVWSGNERRQSDRRNHAAYRAPDAFEEILQGVPKEEKPSSQNLLVRAYRNFARKF